jgi:hypothetical protein
VEVLKSNSGSMGTCKHMDQMDGVHNVLAPINTCASTSTAFYVYESYPQYLGIRSHVPADWSSLGRVTIPWEVGDALIVPADYIHWAPPNNTEYTRFVFFGAGISTKMGFSDSEVITEYEFARRRWAFRFSQETLYQRYWTASQDQHTYRRLAMAAKTSTVVPPAPPPPSAAPTATSSSGARAKTGDGPTRPIDAPSTAAAPPTGAAPAMVDAEAGFPAAAPAAAPKILTERVITLLNHVCRSLPKDLMELGPDVVGDENTHDLASVYFPYLAKMAHDFLNTPDINGVGCCPLKFHDFAAEHWRTSSTKAAKEIFAFLDPKYFLMGRNHNEHRLGDGASTLLGAWLQRSGECRRFFIGLEEDATRRDELQTAEDAIVKEDTAKEAQTQVPHTRWNSPHPNTPEHNATYPTHLKTPGHTTPPRTNIITTYAQPPPDCVFACSGPQSPWRNR